MFYKFCILFCAVLLFVHVNAFVKRDVSSPPPDPLASLQKNLNSFKDCVDKSLAQAVNDVDVQKKLQPVFNIVGDQLNRLSKAFEDLTAPSSTPDPFKFK